MCVGCSLALQAGHTILLSVAVSTSVRRQLVQKSAPQLSCRGRHRTFLHNLHCMVETLTGYRSMLDVYVYFCVPICVDLSLLCAVARRVCYRACICWLLTGPSRFF